ncbi:MAG TPA: LysM peptidoglycan-binding domain-containing protein [Opitutaceae bacterium]
MKFLRLRTAWPTPLLALSLGAALAATTPDELAALRAKAERGNAIAQYNLGLIYSDQREAAHDVSEAYVWLQLAADNGATGRALGTVSDQMTPAQLAEGQRRLAVRRAQFSPIRPANTTGAPVITPAPVSSAADAAIAEIEALRADKRQLSDELAAAWKETEQLKAASAGSLNDVNKRLAIAEAALANKEKELAAAAQRATPPPDSAALENLRRERDQLVATANTTSTELAALRAQHARIQSELTAAQQKLGTAEAGEKEINALKTQLTQAGTDRTTLEQRATAAEQRATELQQQLAAATERGTASTAELASLREQLDSAKAEASSLAKTRDDLETQLTEARTSAQNINNSGAELVTLRRYAQETAGKLAAAEKERDQALARLQTRDRNERELADLKRELATVRREQEELTRQRNEAREALATAKKKPSPDAATLATARQHATELEARVAALTAERDELAQKLASVPPADTAAPAADTAALADVRRQHADSEAKLAASLRAFSVQANELNRVKAALATIDNERSSAADKLAAASTELESLRPAAAGQEAAQAEIDKLREQLASTTTTAEERAAALAQIERERDESRTAAGNATAELGAVREQLRQTQAQTTNLALEVRELRTRLALSAQAPAATLAAPTRPGSAPALTAPAAAPAAASSMPAPPPASRTHTVVSGDSLTKISRQYYGTANRWNEILEANRGVIRDANALVVGTQLRIP